MTGQKGSTSHSASTERDITTSKRRDGDGNSCSSGWECGELGSKEVHIAPMLDVSNQEFRTFLRLLTKRTTLWTEMVVAETLVHCEPSDYDLHLKFDRTQHPITCQIGGNVPAEAAFATKLVHGYGYDAVDVNMECPSNRVAGKREFGAALMKDIDTAVQMVQAISKVANDLSLPFSVKTRIGIDESDTMEFLLDFIGRLVHAGCHRLVIHARKVYSQGFSPAQNRSVPPLNYQRVYALCEQFPKCQFWLNGGLKNLRDAKRVVYGDAVLQKTCHVQGDVQSTVNGYVQREHTVPCHVCSQPYGSCVAPPPSVSPSNLCGVMLGRLAMENPCAFADADRYLFGESRNPCSCRKEVLLLFAEWLERVYPRRCCDDNPIVTRRMYLDGIDIARARQCCNICKECYGTQEVYDDQKLQSTQATIPPINLSTSLVLSDGTSKHRRHDQKCPGAKIISRIIDRSLKPVHGILFGQPGNATFKRELHRLSRDMTVRNCGPGFILRKAMTCIPDEVWRMNFKTMPE